MLTRVTNAVYIKTVNSVHASDMEKVILCFGASSGIGLATAQKLSDRSDIVYNASRTQPADGSIRHISCDVTRVGDIENAVNTVYRQYNRLDAIIYAAGYSMAAPIEYAREEDYRYLFDVNYFGAVRAIGAAVPAMRGVGGRIVILGSLGGILPIAYDSFYSSSKAAVDMLVRGANIELNRFSIYVTGMQIGPTCTHFTFKRNVYPATTVGVYGEGLQKATAVLAGMEQGGMTPNTVADDIIKVLDSEHPPVLTGTGFKNKVVVTARKLLPLRIVDSINRQQYLGWH